MPMVQSTPSPTAVAAHQPKPVEFALSRRYWRYLQSILSRADVLRLLTVALVLIAFQAQVAQAQSWSRLKTSEWSKTNFDINSVEPGEIMSGGPPRDGIPPVDNPAFVDFEAASLWLKDNEPVVAFEHAGIARAYPLQILIYHEIVNDSLAGKPFTVTFCPLCNASIVFEREVEGQVLDFGTTGRLRKSDLIMYDRQTESWWQQFTGIGIVGDFTGTKLVQVPSQIISFETFRNAFPEGEVLSKETGFFRRYGSNPYQGYDSIDNSPFLYRGKLDPRLKPMERVLSVSQGDRFQLLPLSVLAEQPLLSLESGDQAVVVFATSAAASALDQSSIAESRDIPAAAAFLAQHQGQMLTFKLQDQKIVDEQTGSTWNALGYAIAGELEGARLKQLDNGVHFAFAWLAFDPDAKIYGQ